LGSLYAGVKDSSNKTAAVVHPNPNAVRAGVWIQWKTPPADFSGVNPARMRTLYLGVDPDSFWISLEPAQP
jgi:hypothetical protein